MEKYLILIIVSGLASFFFGVMIRSVFQKNSNNSKCSERDKINNIEKTTTWMRTVLPRDLESLGRDTAREIASINDNLIEIKDILKDNGKYLQKIIINK